MLLLKKGWASKSDWLGQQWLSLPFWFLLYGKFAYKMILFEYQRDLKSYKESHITVNASDKN